LLDADKLDDFLIRLTKGMEYYRSMLLEQRKLLVKHIRMATMAKRGRRYMNDLKDLDQMLGHYWLQVSKVYALAEGIVHRSDAFDFSATQKAHELARIALADAIEQVPLTKKKKKKKKKAFENERSQPASMDISMRMFREGMTIDEIATVRALDRSTIESEFSRAAELGLLVVTDVLDQPAIDEITAAIAIMEDGFGLAALHHHLRAKYGFWQLRAVISDLVSRDNLS
jgi:hypothetical protein